MIQNQNNCEFLSTLKWKRLWNQVPLPDLGQPKEIVLQPYLSIKQNWLLSYLAQELEGTWWIEER